MLREDNGHTRKQRKRFFANGAQGEDKEIDDACTIFIYDLAEAEESFSALRRRCGAWAHALGRGRALV